MQLPSSQGSDRRWCRALRRLQSLSGHQQIQSLRPPLVELRAKLETHHPPMMGLAASFLGAAMPTILGTRNPWNGLVVDRSVAPCSVDR